MNDKEVEEILAGFAQYKRNLGYAFDGKMVISYRRLASFLGKRAYPGEPFVSKEKAFDWIASGGSAHRTTCNRRASQVRVFAKYLVRAGYTDCYILPSELSPGESKGFSPYIFTHSEIKTLTTIYDATKPIGQSPFRHAIYPALFRMLYGCGLRSSEATNLLVRDVNFDGDVIFVRKTKNEDSRYVPMSQTLAYFLRDFYADAVGLKERSKDMPFFLYPRGGRYDERIILAVFQDHCEEAGIANQQGRSPRVHDLRHTFAVHSLEAATERGVSAQSFLPVLATYMGHKDIKATEYYLHLTQEGQDGMILKMKETYGALYENGEINV